MIQTLSDPWASQSWQFCEAFHAGTGPQHLWVRWVTGPIRATAFWHGTSLCKHRAMTSASWKVEAEVLDHPSFLMVQSKPAQGSRDTHRARFIICRSRVCALVGQCQNEGMLFYSGNLSTWAASWASAESGPRAPEFFCIPLTKLVTYQGANTMFQVSQLRELPSSFHLSHAILAW